MTVSSYVPTWKKEFYEELTVRENEVLNWVCFSCHETRNQIRRLRRFLDFGIWIKLQSECPPSNAEIESALKFMIQKPNLLIWLQPPPMVFNYYTLREVRDNLSVLMNDEIMTEMDCTEMMDFKN